MIVGLGNPGYDGTRHNVGFMVVDEVRHALHAGRWTRAGAFDYARGTEAGMTILLVKPLTYMNLSGTAVREALVMTGTLLERTLIVLDDFQIPLGALRMRPSGSDGGHRGLASVITTLGTEAVPRLRCGIGGDALPPKEERRDFVLENFSAGEDAEARAMIGRAAEAARVFATSGIGRAMTVYNTQ
jgi:PTH1 family peptidyl-tRNA hydrolase